MAMHVPNDDDAFLAALSFVDEFPFDTASKLNTEHRLKPLPSLKPVKLDLNEAKQRRRRQVNERKKLLRKTGVYGDPNRARSERRQEIALLRKQLEQMQIDVQVLRGREVKRRPSTEEPQPAALTVLPRVPAVWQEMALRQQQRREEAERENIRLKLVLKRQQQVAQALGDLVRRRAIQVTKGCADLTIQPRFRHHAVNVLDVKGDMEDFRLLILGLEAAYLEMEDVFAANGLSGSELPPVDVHLREGVGRMHIECFSYKVLPFELRATTAAVWEHFKGVEKHFGGGNIYSKAAKDLAEPYTIIENFTKELYSNASRADIKVKQVVRRYVEQNHDVVIWLAHVAPAEIKHKMLRGLAYTLRGYAVTKRSQVAGQEVSVLQQCSIISFDRDASTWCSTTNLDTLMNFLVVNSAQNIRSHRERIEDMLVDQAVGRRIH